MKMINVAIIDDDADVCSSLGQMLNDLYGSQVKVQSFIRMQDFSYYFDEMHNESIDIVLMDIVLDEGLGIDLAIEYEKINKKTKVIFITGYIDYAPDIFKAEPFGLLRKPFSIEKVKHIIDKAIKVIEQEESDFVSISTKESVRNIRLKDIRYAESKARKLYIHTIDGTIDIYMKLSEFEGKLKNNIFIRCHQSYLVNARFISSISVKEIMMDNNTIIPVSRKQSESSKKLFIDFLKQKYK